MCEDEICPSLKVIQQMDRVRNPSVHDPVAPGESLLWRWTPHTPFEWLLCHWRYYLEKKVGAASPSDDGGEEGRGAEATRWLLENEWAPLLSDWCLSFVTLKASDLTMCVCHAVWGGALLDSFHYKWHSPGRQLHWRQGSQCCQGLWLMKIPPNNRIQRERKK